MRIEFSQTSCQSTEIGPITFHINFKKLREELEVNLKLFEKNLSTEENQCLYDKCKRDVEEIYDNIAEGIRIRSRCQWYEEGEKSSKSFLNLEKFNGMQSQIRKMIVKKYLILI